MSQPQSTVSIPANSSMYPVLSRYQQHVHHLEKQVSNEIILSREEALGFRIPLDLKQFLLTHNGAILFDGDLIIRSVMELSPVTSKHPSVISFATMHIQVNPIQIDGVETEMWAYVIDSDGHPMYGLWGKDEFTPLYRDFPTWLNSSIRLLDEGTFPNVWTRRKMLSNTPVFFEQRNVGLLLETNRYEEAASVLGRWLQENSTPTVWMQYAHALKNIHQDGWENGYIEAVRALHFPLSYPNMVPKHKDWITSIVKKVPLGASTIVEICNQLWNEEILSITSGEILSEADLFVLEEVALCIWEYGVDKEIKEFLSTINKLCPDFTPSRLLLSQIEHLINVAEHDKAETAIFALQRRCPELQTQCLLLLARIVVRRHEPWGLHILFDLMDQATSPLVLQEALLMAAQYCLDNESLSQASTFLDQLEVQIDTDNQGVHSAWYWLLRGQLAHYNQLVGPAGQYIARGNRLVPSNNPWLKGWLFATEASIYSSRNMVEKAEGLYEQAMNLFSQYGYKLEMAEVLMKWGQTSKEATYFQRARQLFRNIEFASGVSVADRFLGEVDGSWNWYLDVTKELIQRHLFFERVNTKGIRQQADRPER